MKKVQAENTQRIKDYLKEHPDAYQAQIVKALNLSRQTVRKHLRRIDDAT